MDRSVKLSEPRETPVYEDVSTRAGVVTPTDVITANPRPLQTPTASKNGYVHQWPKPSAVTPLAGSPQLVAIWAEPE